MKADLQQYFIAILPSADISEEARKLQLDFVDKYNAKAALRSPPHITMHMPFRWKEAKEGELVSSLSEFFAGIAPFNITIDGFGCFPPRVVFMNIVQTKELIDTQKRLARFCRMKLGLFNASHGDEPYHPHLTLAFRDLKKPTFSVAWADYGERSYHATSTVNSICLLKHNGMMWEPMKYFGLSGRPND